MKMVYVGPGDDDRSMEVHEDEVEALELTGLWKKASKKAKSEGAATDDKKGSDS